MLGTETSDTVPTTRQDEQQPAGFIYPQQRQGHDGDTQPEEKPSNKKSQEPINSPLRTVLTSRSATVSPQRPGDKSCAAEGRKTTGCPMLQQQPPSSCDGPLKETLEETKPKTLADERGLSSRPSGSLAVGYRSGDQAAGKQEGGGGTRQLGSGERTTGGRLAAINPCRATHGDDCGSEERSCRRKTGRRQAREQAVREAEKNVKARRVEMVLQVFECKIGSWQYKLTLQSFVRFIRVELGKVQGRMVCEVACTYIGCCEIACSGAASLSVSSVCSKPS